MTKESQTFHFNKIGVVLHSIQLELQITSDTQIFKSTDAPHAITQMFMFKMTHIPAISLALSTNVHLN